VSIISGKLLNPNGLFVSFSITKGQVGICDAKQWRGDKKSQRVWGWKSRSVVQGICPPEAEAF